jgi:hypothetical protein
VFLCIPVCVILCVLLRFRSLFRVPRLHFGMLRFTFIGATTAALAILAWIVATLIVLA